LFSINADFYTAVINIPLSQARAQSVRSYLASQGVSASRIDAQGYGLKKPPEGGF
jgi:outer membrane protein OmpA-like peptidoglycan-associated protein